MAHGPGIRGAWDRVATDRILGADLRGADLHGARLDGAVVDSALRLDGARGLDTVVASWLVIDDRRVEGSEAHAWLERQALLPSGTDT